MAAVTGHVSMPHRKARKGRKAFSESRKRIGLALVACMAVRYLDTRATRRQRTVQARGIMAAAVALLQGSTLHLAPHCLHLVERGVVDTEPALLQHLFQRRKAPGELVVRFPQR